MSPNIPTTPTQSGGTIYTDADVDADGGGGLGKANEKDKRT